MSSRPPRLVRSRLPLLGLLCMLAAGAQSPGAASSGFTDPVGPFLLALTVLLVAAKGGAAVMLRWGQPAVLGELLAGVLLAAVAPVCGGREWLAAATVVGGPLDVLARLGAVLLLFMVGLECDLRAMTRLGGRALAISSLGVLATLVLGFGASRLCLPGGGPALTHAFVAVALCATSVGVTARVFRDLGRLETDDARLVLGAAVLDDVMGLVLLALAAGALHARAAGTSLPGDELLRILCKALGFLWLALTGGLWLAPRAFAVTARLRGEGVLLVTALAFCFALAGLAQLAGLAPIIGAFAAGLLLEEVHYVEFRQRHGVDHKLEDLLRPLAELLVPLFFVQMGLSVKLGALGSVGAVVGALALTLAAVGGKLACALGAPTGARRLSVGLAMVPRGEVTLICAALGHQALLDGRPVLNDAALASLLVVVLASTLLTPPLLARSLRSTA